MQSIRQNSLELALSRVSVELNSLSNDLRSSEEAVHQTLSGLNWAEISSYAEEIQSMDRIIQSLDALSKYLMALSSDWEVEGSFEGLTSVVHLEDLRARLCGYDQVGKESSARGPGSIDIF